MQLTEKIITHFWSHVDKSSGCWTWTGAKTRNGYGRFNTIPHIDYAHRVSWTIAYGEIPTAMFVCHSCDNPSCVNPEHLFIGTQSDNMRDMAIKCRSHFTKLTHPEVSQIRKLRGGGLTTVEIARRFNVCSSLITQIAKRRIWKNSA